ARAAAAFVLSHAHARRALSRGRGASGRLGVAALRREAAGGDRGLELRDIRHHPAARPARMPGGAARGAGVSAVAALVQVARRQARARRAGVFREAFALGPATRTLDIGSEDGSAIA